MAQLLVCTTLCLLHFAIGLAIGMRLKGAPPLAFVGSPEGASQFVRLELQRLAQDWAAIRCRLDQFLSAAERVEPLPRDLLRHSLSELNQTEIRLRATINDGATESNVTKPFVQSHDVAQHERAPLTNPQIVELFETDRTAEAALVRHKFAAKQPMAPIIDDRLPTPDSFQLVQCHDLSVTEIRFFDDSRPTADRVVIGLGQPSPAKWLVAEIVDYRIVAMYGRTGYLVTAQFLAGIGTRRDADNFNRRVNQMSLFALGETQNPVTIVPHRLLLNGWKARLRDNELVAIEVELNQLVNRKKGNEISTARWLPCEISPLGHHDWEGSPLMRLWDKACERDRTRTCWCFAVLLFEHMMKRPDAWHFKTFDLDDAPMANTRYYRCQVHTERPSAATVTFPEATSVP